MPVAIERPNGRLVDLLLEAGHPVVPVSPNAIKTWREGEVLSGAKSDAGDAAVLAEYLRLRQHRLRTAAPYSDETLALRSPSKPHSQSQHEVDTGGHD
jgi:transposase